MPEKYLDSLVILAVQFYDVHKVTFITEFLSILAYPQTFFVFFLLFSRQFDAERSERTRTSANSARIKNKEQSSLLSRFRSKKGYVTSSLPSSQGRQSY